MGARHILLGALLLAAPAAWAEHFTIHVPVELHSIVQGVARAKVFCEVRAANGERLGAKYGPWLDIVNGELSTTTTIALNTYNGKDPHDAVRYRCHLELLTPWVQNHPWNQPMASGNNLYLTPKPGSEFHPLVEGPIPQTVHLRAPRPRVVPPLRR